MEDCIMGIKKGKKCKGIGVIRGRWHKGKEIL